MNRRGRCLGGLWWSQQLLDEACGAPLTAAEGPLRAHVLATTAVRRCFLRPDCRIWPHAPAWLALWPRTSSLSLCLSPPFPLSPLAMEKQHGLGKIKPENLGFSPGPVCYFLSLSLLVGQQLHSPHHSTVMCTSVLDTLNNAGHCPVNLFSFPTRPHSCFPCQ